MDEADLAQAIRQGCVVIEPPPGTPLLSLEIDPSLALGSAGAAATLMEKPTPEHPWATWRMADGSKIRITETQIMIWTPFAGAATAAARRALSEGWKTVAVRGYEEGRVTAAVAFLRHGVEEEDSDLRARAIVEDLRQQRALRARQEVERRMEERRKADEAEAARAAEAARLDAEVEAQRKREDRVTEQARLRSAAASEPAPAKADPVAPMPAPPPKKRRPPAMAR